MKSLDHDTAKAYGLAAINRLKANLPPGWEVRAITQIHGMQLREGVAVVAPVGSKHTIVVSGDSRHLGSVWSSASRYKAVISIRLGDEHGVRLHGPGLTRRYDVKSPEGEFNAKGLWKAATDLLVQAVEIDAAQAKAREVISQHEALSKMLSDTLGVKVTVVHGWDRSNLRASFEVPAEDMSALVARLQGKVNG